MKNYKDKYLSYCRSYTVAVDEVDFAERLKPSAVLQYFQDLATAHADVLGIGFETMLKKNLIWVLTNISVQFNRYPEIGEEITVTTFPRKPSTAYALRDYYVTDSDGNVLISATSKWVVIDVQSRMIRRCNILFDFPDEVYFPNPPFENGNKTIDDNGEFIAVMSDKVRVSDIDRNKHMNNARYGDMILNSFDLEKFANSPIGRFDINFVSEMRFGDEYTVFKSEREAVTVLHAKRNGETVFRAEIAWN